MKNLLLPSRIPSRILLFGCLFAMILPAAAGIPLTPRTKTILSQLDEVVEHKEEYRQDYIRSIDNLKHRAAMQHGVARLRTWCDIYRKYSRFQTDSASHYLDLIEQSPETAAHKDIADFLHIGRAEVLAVTGLYSEAATELADVHPDALSAENRITYFHLSRTLYGWMADYVVSHHKREHLLELTGSLRDSIIKYESDPIGRNIVIADKAIVEGETDRARRLLLKDLQHAGNDLRPYIYFNLAVCAKLDGAADDQIYYLAETAITDIRRGVTEYEALGLLAQLLEKQGEVERAYNYLICTMEDAVYCKARLRTIEASNIFPIIDKAYKQEAARQHRNTLMFAYTMGALMLLLAGGVAFLLIQKRRLTTTRRKLADANAALHEVYDNLQQTDKVKEEYLARYLNRCHDYLETLENYRRQLLKMVKAGQIDNLSKTLGSTAMVAEEKARFYADFDSAFLTLYPHFIERVNALLQEDARITPRKGELLTTELRIFALIRLGVNDSAHIAHFLGYSLATIYNYRSKLRGKSLCGKDNFEKEIMEI